LNVSFLNPFIISEVTSLVIKKHSPLKPWKEMSDRCNVVFSTLFKSAVKSIKSLRGEQYTRNISNSLYNGELEIYHFQWSVNVLYPEVGLSDIRVFQEFLSGPFLNYPSMLEYVSAITHAEGMLYILLDRSYISGQLIYRPRRFRLAKTQ